MLPTTRMKPPGTPCCKINTEGNDLQSKSNKFGACKQHLAALIKYRREGQMHKLIHPCQAKDSAALPNLCWARKLNKNCQVSCRQEPWTDGPDVFTQSFLGVKAKQVVIAQISRNPQTPFFQADHLQTAQGFLLTHFCSFQGLC